MTTWVDIGSGNGLLSDGTKPLSEAILSKVFCGIRLKAVSQKSAHELKRNNPDNTVHGSNMGPTWVLSSPGGPHVGPMNLVIWDVFRDYNFESGHQQSLFCKVLQEYVLFQDQKDQLKSLDTSFVVAEVSFSDPL